MAEFPKSTREQVTRAVIDNSLRNLDKLCDRLLQKEPIKRGDIIHELRTLRRRLNALASDHYSELPGISKPVAPRFRKPSMEEVIDFARTLDLPPTDGEWFYTKGEGCGWKNDGKPIIDWQATMRAWKLAFVFPSQKPKNNGMVPPKPSITDRQLQRAIANAERLCE